MNKKTRIIAEIAVAIALAMIFNFIKLWRMPYGGSITLEMIPIFIIALRWGLGPGMMAGTAYGFLQLVFDPYIIHPAQFILDYPLAYFMLGFAGLFKNKIQSDKQLLSGDKDMFIWIIIAMIIGTILRFGVHVISGVIYFSHYAGEQNVWIYSIIYNGTFIFPSLLLSFVVIMPLKRVFLIDN